MSYVYDPDGNLVRRTVDSTTTTYVVDTNGELPVVLLDRTSAAITATYVYGDDLICFHDGDLTADRYYYFFDASGSIAAITDILKDVRVLHECDAFGNGPFCVPLFDETEKVSFASAGHSDLFASPDRPQAPLPARAAIRADS